MYELYWVCPTYNHHCNTWISLSNICWFTNREWIRLSTQVVNTNTIETFKRKSDKFMDEDDK